MITIFLIVALLISALLYLNRNKVINYTLVVAYGVSLIAFTCYQLANPNQVELGFFKSDSLGLLLLTRSEERRVGKECRL